MLPCVRVCKSERERNRERVCSRGHRRVWEAQGRLQEGEQGTRGVGMEGPLTGVSHPFSASGIFKHVFKKKRKNGMKQEKK